MKVRIANNKNIQNMEQKDIDIYEILKGMPDGTPLYTPLCGNVEFTSVTEDKEKAEAIWTEDKNGEYSFDKKGIWMKGGEVLIFPSKEMRDWSKFFKKGDVLGCYEGKKPYYAIFDGFENNTYQTFNGKFAYDSYEDKWYQNEGNLSTITFHKLSRADSETYIKKIEERFGGKLNMETLEIEKPAKPTFEIGKLYVFNDEDEDGELTIIGKLIDENESEDTLRFGNQYEIENEKFVTDKTFDLCISVHDELREATEDEAVTFKEAYTQLEKSKKQPVFKPFDKVLVRIGSEFKWRPALFIRDHGDNCTNRYNVLPLYSGNPADFEHCIPYEGHENIAFTDYDIENLPF